MVATAVIGGGVLAVCWAINPFLRKRGSSKLNYKEFAVLNHFILTILFIVVTVFMIYRNHVEIKCFKRLSTQDWAYILSGSIATLIATFIFIYLLQIENASNVIFFSQPVSLILTVLFGYLFFSEGVTSTKLWACGIILIGVYILNKNK